MLKTFMGMKLVLPATITRFTLSTIPSPTRPSRPTSRRHARPLVLLALGLASGLRAFAFGLPLGLGLGVQLVLIIVIATLMTRNARSRKSVGCVSMYLTGVSIWTRGIRSPRSALCRHPLGQA